MMKRSDGREDQKAALAARLRGKLQYKSPTDKKMPLASVKYGQEVIQSLLNTSQAIMKNPLLTEDAAALSSKCQTSIITLPTLSAIEVERCVQNLGAECLKLSKRDLESKGK